MSIDENAYKKACDYDANFRQKYGNERLSVRSVIEAYEAAKAEQPDGESNIYKNIAHILDTVPTYYKAELGDRIANIFDITAAIMAEVDRARPKRESESLLLSNTIHQLKDAIRFLEMGQPAEALQICKEALTRVEGGE